LKASTRFPWGTMSKQGVTVHIDSMRFAGYAANIEYFLQHPKGGEAGKLNFSRPGGGITAVLTHITLGWFTRGSHGRRAIYSAQAPNQSRVSRPTIRRGVIVSIVVALVAVAGVAGYFAGKGTGSQVERRASAVPPVSGFYEGQEVLFIHTEASDPTVVSMLTSMMGSSVILVPSLGQISALLLSDVYVFTNGVRGNGPFGFQPDVFSSVPGDRNYTPLRALNLVTWKEGASARELHSVGELKALEVKGELTISRPGIVVNMPMVEWPGGQR